jgi:AcrR family transcriptional regulator
VAPLANKSNTFSKLKPGPSLPQAEVAEDQLARIREAMVQVVARDGYGGLKVRNVVALAKVSSRSFYQHFDSKEMCLRRTYKEIARRARTELIAAQVDGADWVARSRRILSSFVEALRRDPAAARLALLEVRAGDDELWEEVHTTEAAFVSMLAQSVGRDPGGMSAPALVVEGMAAGVLQVARARLLAGTPEALAECESELMAWLQSFPCEETGALVELDGGSVRRSATLPEMRRRARAGVSTGDRATVLAAVAKLYGAEGHAYEDLTVPAIRAAAGVSRRVFDANFDGVEDCVLGALEPRAAVAIADAATEQTAGVTWAGGVYRAISSLSAEIAAEPLLARTALRDEFQPGSKGSRARRALADAFVDQVQAGIPAKHQPSELTAEASVGAIWGLFHRHALVGRSANAPRMAATLAYMVLAPLVGGPAAIAAIRGEQS